MGCTLIYKGKEFKNKTDFLNYISSNINSIENDIKDFSIARDFKELNISGIEVDSKNNFKINNISFKLNQDKDTAHLSFEKVTLDINKAAVLMQEFYSMQSFTKFYGTNNAEDTMMMYYNDLKNSKKKVDRENKKILSFLVNDKYVSEVIDNIGGGIIERDGKYIVATHYAERVKKELDEIKELSRKNPSVSTYFIKAMKLEEKYNIITDTNFNDIAKESEKEFINNISKYESLDQIKNEFGKRTNEDLSRIFEFSINLSKSKGLNKIKIPSELSMKSKKFNEQMSVLFRDTKEINESYLGALVLNVNPKEKNTDNVVLALTNENWQDVLVPSDVEMLSESVMKKYRNNKDIQDYLEGKLEAGKSSIIEKHFGVNKSTNPYVNLYYLNENKVIEVKELNLDINLDSSNFNKSNPIC